ncbi:hypothetical protein [Mesorhizobium sp. WSM4312]|uniref:hypothetical protein n=1 Tax=Mesorhizobium sp. WSM4312 TaxID=2029411 RepID=UPI001180CB0F|nr:hypothetical protein [Mesorhizobium sp. WSM4312]
MYLFTQSEIHEILVSVLFSTGVMIVGLSRVIALLERQLTISTDRGSPARVEVPDPSPSHHSLYRSHFEVE